jgi:hypothetical protein
VTGSPLKQSLTPSKSVLRPQPQSRRGIATDEGALDQSSELEEGPQGDSEAGTGVGSEAEMRTPTKKRKFHPAGVDLSSASASQALDEAEQVLQQYSSRKKETTSAFMALRPGRSSAQAVLQEAVDRGLPAEEREYLARRREMARRRVVDQGRTVKTREKRDWTYRESVWGEKQSTYDSIWDAVSF